MLSDCLDDLKSRLPGGSSSPEGPHFGTLFFSLPTHLRFTSFEVLEGKQKKGIFVSFLTGVGFQMVLETIIG